MTPRRAAHAPVALSYAGCCLMGRVRHEPGCQAACAGACAASCSAGGGGVAATRHRFATLIGTRALATEFEHRSGQSVGACVCA